MHRSHTDDPIDGFTLELLRAGDMLIGPADELAEAVPPDTYPGESSGDAVLQMISGTIRSFLVGADAAEVERATELMAGAVERVIEHLRLALGHRRRMDADREARPGDDSPAVARVSGDAPGEPRPETAGPVDPAGPLDPRGDLATELLECGGVLSQLIAGMAEYEASGQAPPDAAPIPEVAHALVREVLVDIRERHPARDLAVAAQIVREATEGIANDIYVVEPESN